MQGNAWFVAGGKARSGMMHADAWSFDFKTHTWKRMSPVLRSNPQRPLVLSLGTQVIEKDNKIVAIDPVTGGILPLQLKFRLLWLLYTATAAIFPSKH